MKTITKLTFLLFICLLSVPAFTQDTIRMESRKILIGPFAEAGLNIIQNDLLKMNYENQSMLYWGFGITLGHPSRSAIIPYIKYSRSQLSMQKEIVNKNGNNQITSRYLADSALKIIKFSGGVVIPLLKKDKFHLKTKLAYTLSKINESFYGIDAYANGAEIGIGMERKIFRSSRIYWDISYNYQKSGKENFRDFDMISLAMGFVL